MACALPAVRLRYLAASARDRQRMQWMAAGGMLAADSALVVVVLHVLVGWPGPVAAVAAGCGAFLAFGMMAGELRSLGPYGGRVLVQVLSIAGFTTVVAAIYLVIVLGIGSGASDAADREILGLSMLAAAVAAIGYLPARDRLVASATRFVYGAREAPDETLRTFGSRLTRAIPMDELLLQLAESLRKTMALTSAEVYTGAGDVLELVAAVPDTGPRSVVVTARERAVVTRAGVSGNAWASVWLPALLDGRAQVQIRVAPVSHAGDLLGLIIAERPAAGDAFSDEDDRVLTELARQVGLAVHNARLDTALQTTLDELRNQADELRQSRARIVASGDAERRRVERNLHDGAQQHLVAMAVNLRLTRDIMADDPQAAAEMLDQLAGDVKDTIQELRELAHGIYPPLLADSGLGEALRAAGNRSPLPVTVYRRRDRPLHPGHRGGYLLLLPGSAAECRQARAGGTRGGTGLGGRQGACCSRSATTAPASTPPPPAAATASSTWPTGSAPSAARFAGSRSRARAPRSLALCRCSDRPLPGPLVSRDSRSAGRERARVPLLPQPADRIGGQPFLVDVGGRAAGRGRGRKVGSVVARAEDHDHIGMGGRDLTGRLDPAHLRHVDVHQHEGRVQPVDQLDRLRAARRLASELEALKTAQHGPGGRAERRLVIYHEHGTRAGHGISLSRAVAAAEGAAIRSGGVASLPGQPRNVTASPAG